jgi:hypothetical protein
LKTAEEAGADLFFLPVVDELGTDVAVLKGAGSPERFLIHLSGIHGVEGYAGSAIQSASLKYLGEQYNKNKQDKEEFKTSNEEEDVEQEENDVYSPTIVFVHAMNPYGFANNRRVNEDNVDLNRNFLTEDDFVAARARDPNYAG